jgi:hypothetical protein
MIHAFHFLCPLAGRFSSSIMRWPTLQTLASRRPLNNSFTHYPQVTQRNQREF